MRHSWRDVQEWKQIGFPMSTASNEAAKLFDASLNQFLGWFDDPTLGGLENSLEKMIAADPNFVLGHCLTLGIEFMGTGRKVRHDSQFTARIEEFENLVNKQTLSKVEAKHVEAVLHLAKNDFYTASRCYEDILLECPHDMFALKIAQDIYFFLGLLPQLKDSVARVVPLWQSKNIPLKSYIHGLYAFGLEENHFYKQAQVEGLKGLEQNINDAWATHSLAHVYEMEGQFQEGLNYMEKTLNNWKVGNHLATHNYWHMALYNIEIGQYDAAYDLLESEIISRTVQSSSLFNIVDAASLLYRLELTELVKRNNEKYWDQLHALSKSHLRDHITAFNDCHFMMTVLGKKNFSEANEMLDSLNENEDILGKNVVRPLLNAMVEFEREQYSKAVDLLNPIRYKIIEIGGSNAQRDLFNQLLIVASMKSPVDCHRELARRLLHERDALKASPLGHRLLTKLNA